MRDNIMFIPALVLAVAEIAALVVMVRGWRKDRRAEDGVDAVEVVRCKDCKFLHDRGYCTLVTGMTRIKPDDFCSHGERRTDG